MLVSTMGGDLFFVLGGFLIYGTLISRCQAFPYFMYRRIKRIHPVFTVVLALSVILSFTMPAPAMFFVTLGPCLVLFLAVKQPLPPVQANPPASGPKAPSAPLANVGAQ